MKVAGRGRIIIWEGASLWIMEVVPAHVSGHNATDFHAHHAIQVTMALDGRFELRSKTKSASNCAAVAPDVEHFFQAQGLVALLFVEPESEAGRAISASLFPRADLVALSKPALGGIDGELLAQYRRSKSDEAALEKIGRKLVAHLAVQGHGATARKSAASRFSAGGATIKKPEPRIRKIMHFASTHLDDAVTLGAAAKSAGLSPGRARHLFVEQTGLAFRKYLLWLRLTRALGLFAKGASLTSAAHEAGFSDSAHFSRTFRRMFGISAAMLEIL